MKLELILLFASSVLITQSAEPKFSPYIDVTLPGLDLASAKSKYGVKAFSLAFALGGTAGCSPMWGGQIALNDSTIIKAIKAFTSAGGDVIVSTGGAMGPYLETSCKSAADLTAAYKKVLDITGSTHLDIDVESSVPLDIMNSALASVQKSNSAVTVQFTLMVQGDDYGVTQVLGTDVLKSAVSKGVRVDIVNPMVMDFSSSTNSSFGQAVINAGEAVVKQMKTIFTGKSDAQLYGMLGMTPMIGKNDNGKTFDTAAAQQLVTWAKNKKIGHLAFWSFGRDNGNCANKAVSPNCSSISQDDHAFTKIFNTFS